MQKTQNKKFIIGAIFLLSIYFPIKVLGLTKDIEISELTKCNIKGIGTALKMFKLDNGIYPSIKEGLGALMKNPNFKKYPNYAASSYLNKVVVDSWQNPFIYICYKTEKGDDFQLISFGADGKYGGEGEDEDIVYPNR